MPRTKMTNPNPEKPRPRLKDILTRLTPLALIANLAAALAALGVDIPIVEIGSKATTC